MRILSQLLDLKTYIMTAVAVISFSYSVGHLFGETIPNIVLAFFRYAGESVVLGAVFVFAFIWLLKARPHNRPKNYSIVAFDVYGKESKIEGIRTEFKIHDVAWSFMKQYKKSYPLYNFALVTDGKNAEKRTIFRYI